MCDLLHHYTELGSEGRELRGTGWDRGSGYEDTVFS